MLTYLATFLLSLVVVLLMTPVVRHYAIKWGVVDRPGGRRIHEVPIPRLGGVAIATALFVAVVSVFVYSFIREHVLHLGPSVFVEVFSRNIRAILGMGGGAAAILALGIYDDVKGTRPLLKLAVQIGVALFCIQLGFRVRIIGLPWVDQPLELGVFSLPFTVLWIVVIINAVNLIDGIDGLASGASFFACVTLFILAYNSHDLVDAFALAALAGAMLGFLFFNSHPAMVFLGDSGSMLLGFILAVVSVRGSTKGVTAFSILASAMALGLPLLDTSLAVVRRMLTGKPLMGADQDHIHHRLLRLGLSQRQVVMALYGLSTFLAMIALATSFLRSHKVLLTILFIALAGILLVSMRYLGYVQYIREERRNMFLHDLFNGVATRTDALLRLRSELETSSSWDEVWNALVRLAEPFAIQGLQLTIEGDREGDAPPFSRSLADPAPRALDGNLARIDLKFGETGGRSGALSVLWVQNGGDAHPELYRLFFEFVRRELELAVAGCRARPAVEAGPTAAARKDAP